MKLTQRSFAILALLCLLASTHAHAQAAQASAIRPITLDVVVASKSDAPVAAVQPGDFTLLDNGQPQNAVQVRAVNGLAATTEPPVEVIIVIDAINPAFLTVVNERQWLATFFAQNGGRTALPTSIRVLTAKGMKVQQPATHDGKALTAFMNANVTGLREIRRSEGLEGAMEREEASLKALEFLAVQEQSRPGRKMVLWISPGWSVYSNQSWYGGDRDQQAIYDSVAALSTGLREARITLYAIDPRGERHFDGVEIRAVGRQGLFAAPGSACCRDVGVRLFCCANGLFYASGSEFTRSHKSCE